VLTPQTAHCLQAVRKSAAPKAKPEKAEELKAETPKDKMNELIEASLKEAGLARTSAITLSGLDYAEDLSKVLLTHVQGVEDLFKEVQLLNKKADATPKEFKKMIKKIETKSEGTKKLQASPVSESLTLCLLEVWPPIPAQRQSKYGDRSKRE